MAGRAAGIFHQGIGMRCFGEIVDLLVAMSNDFAVGETVSAASAAMTTPKLKTLLAQAGEALGQWGQVQELTRELVAVKLAVVDGKTVLADRAVYVEDAGGGYWTLKSGTRGASINA